MNWILHLIAGLIAIINLFVSKPQNKRLAYIATLLIVLFSVWSTISEFQRLRDQRGLRNYAYSQLSKAIRSFLLLVSEMIIYSTDEWFPQNEDEFFSPRVVNLICNQLNIDSRFPAVSDRDWLTHIHQRTLKTKEEFDTLLNSHAPSLSHKLLEKIDKVKNSYFFNLSSDRIGIRNFDRQHGTQRPPLLCRGLEDFVEKSLLDIRDLYNHLWSITGEKRIQIPSKRPHLKNLIGKSRFDEKDLAQWYAEHPYAPSGKPPKNLDGKN